LQFSVLFTSDSTSGLPNFCSCHLPYFFCLVLCSLLCMLPLVLPFCTFL
jgi:hypothetical protein